MADECVVGIYDSAAKAEEAVHILDRSGFPRHQISVVASAVGENTEVAKELKYGDDSMKDAALGAGVGGLAGLLIGATVLTISGLGAVLIAGPLAAGLTGALVGAFLGAMRGWGVHDERRREYEEKVKQGKVLLVAHGDPLEVAEAERLLKETDVSELHLHAKTGDDSPEVDDFH
jgi:uncharacterized membrane protein